MVGVRSILRPEMSVQIGVLTGVTDLFIYQHGLPNITDIRSAQPNNGDVETARRQAAFTCVAVNGLVALMTRDWNVFLIGGLVTAAIDLTYKHANAVHPETGKLSAPGETSIDPSLNLHPLPDYGDDNDVSDMVG